MNDATKQEFATGFRAQEGGTYAVATGKIWEMVKGWDRKQKVLDVGTGTGQFLWLFRKLGFDGVTGIDVDEEMAGYAVRRGDVVLVDRALPFAPGSFGYVTVMNVLQDFGNADQVVDFMGEVAEMVRSGGEILVMNASPESYLVDMLNFKCSHYLGNRDAVKRGVGAEVQVDVIGTGVGFVDHAWRDGDLRKIFADVGLVVKNYGAPVASGDGWISETEVSPWLLYLLKKSDR